jgi:hypothetical protein
MTAQLWNIAEFNGRRERRHLNPIDNAVWSAGTMGEYASKRDWSVFAWGYWSAVYIREGDLWKIRMLSLIEHPAPSAETK